MATKTRRVLLGDAATQATNVVATLDELWASLKSAGLSSDADIVAAALDTMTEVQKRIGDAYVSDWREASRGSR